MWAFRKGTIEITKNTFPPSLFEFAMQGILSFNGILFHNEAFLRFFLSEINIYLQIFNCDLI